MKLLKSVCLLALGLTLLTSSLWAAGPPETGQDHSRFQDELNERDFIALREFINTKREIDLKKKATKMSISGDVRFETRHLEEKSLVSVPFDDVYKKHVFRRVRGGGCFDDNGVPLSNWDFDVEFNLYFDYSTDRTWATAQLSFDNGAGIDNEQPCNYDPKGVHGSGYCDDICLKKAYFGYNIFTCGDSRLDIELGRRKLYNVFDSKIQFLSRFDGVLLKYTHKWDWLDAWYWKTAGFVIDERVNQFGFVTEIGFLNIKDTDIDFKYSLIWWPKFGRNRCFVENPRGMRFINSQWTLYYHLEPCYWSLNQPVSFYGAFLVNHDAHARNFKDWNGIHPTLQNPNPKPKIIRTTQNLAWYVGVLIGEVEKEGDYSIEIIYEYVQAQAVSDGDVGGIGRGNVLDDSFTVNERGNSNYKGWKLEALYAITDELTVDSIVEWSDAADKRIGGPHTYSKVEVEFIYAF